MHHVILVAPQIVVHSDIQYGLRIEALHERTQAQRSEHGQLRGLCSDAHVGYIDIANVINLGITHRTLWHEDILSSWCVGNGVVGLIHSHIVVGEHLLVDIGPHLLQLQLGILAGDKSLHVRVVEDVRHNEHFQWWIQPQFVEQRVGTKVQLPISDQLDGICDEDDGAKEQQRHAKRRAA